MMPGRQPRSADVPHSTASVTDSFIKAHLADAQMVQRKFAVPASVVLAQSAYESGWGVSVVDNAYFGIKGHAPDGHSTHFVTHEYDASGHRKQVTDRFRAYAGYQEAAIDYARTLQQSYPEAFTSKGDGLKFVLYLKHYATFPGYVQTLQKIIRQYNLQQYDKQP